MRHIAIVSSLLLCGMAAYAAEGRIPIFEPVELVGPNIEGRYTLVRNISSGDGPAIKVVGTGNERVEINLNGFTVKRVGEGSAISVEGVRSFVLRNGAVTTTGASPVADEPGVVQIVDTSISGEVIVEGLRVSGGFMGIQTRETPNFTIRDNVVSASSSHGIQALGVAETAIGGSITNNQLLDVGSYGIWVGNDETVLDGVIVRFNRVDGPTFDGILIRKARSFIVDSNTVTDAGNVGIKIQASRSGRVTGNTVSGCGTATSGSGIAIINGPAPAPDSAHSLVAGNTSSDNPGWGINVSGNGHRVQHNVVSGNGRGGILIQGDDNVFDGNTARNNTSGESNLCTAPPPGQCSWPDFCNRGTNNASGGGNFLPDPC